jgi:hypothetical protein
VQAFSDVASFAKLSPRLVFLLLGRANLIEANFNVGWELKRGAVKRTGFLL